MCGIFGVISNYKPVDVTRLQLVSDSIKHRGPDGEGFVLINRLEATECSGVNTPKGGLIPIQSLQGSNATSCMIHRRLSIIDLSEFGHQPMRYLNHNIWLTFNGEIYNFKEIRDELILKGYVFQSETDSEVILASYLEWGKDAVKKFNGMWSFAIWDGRNGSWFLSRDRLGIKPLYYALKDDQIVFSSEIKSILKYDDSYTVLCKRKTAEYLKLGQVVIGESNETMFQGVLQLMPGHNLEIVNGKVDISKYWELDFKISNKSRRDNLEEFKCLFEDSVRLRMQSDVELGSCLSGGIDSSSIVAVASKLKKESINTFSAVWPGTRHDERKFMEKVNLATNSNAHYVTVADEDVMELIDKVTWHQEIPLPGSSLLAQWTVMQSARESMVPVLLDGQGADEVLSGYPIYQTVYFNELLSSGKLKELRRFLKSSEHTGITASLMLKRHVKKILGLNFSPSISNTLEDNYSNTLKYPNALDCFSLPKYLIHQITTSNLPSLLHFEDRNSMAHSVEARVPFLDYRLVEFGVNIPSTQKLGDGFTKTILRDTMKGLVPVDILNRRDKVGFTTPIEDRFSNSSYLMNSINDELFKSTLVNELQININDMSNPKKFRVYLLSRFEKIFRTQFI